MSQENVEMVQRAFDAFNRGDRDAAVADVAPDFEYVASGAIPGATGKYRGPEGFKRFTGWLLDQFDEARVELTEVIDAGDQVVVRARSRGRGRRSGAETSWDTWQVWTVRDGKAVRGEGFTSREEALEAAGLSE
jgi:ketosteroid isomerase-like protein